MISALIDAVSALGGFAGLGAMLASLAALAKTKQVKADTQQLQPNHGKSMSDRLDLMIAMTRSNGHQIGELRRDHQDLRVHVDTLTRKD